jgi:signal transduction histidine kinase
VRLAPKLLLAFGVVASLSTASLGVFEREQWRTDATARFDDEVRSACLRLRDEMQREAERDRKLIGAACQAGELVDRTLVAIEAGELESRRTALAALVPSEREAFDLDELVLATDAGDVLGAEPRALLGLPRADIVRAVRGPVEYPLLRLDPARGGSAFVTRCRRSSRAGRSVALVGARTLAPLASRIAKTLDVGVSLGDAKADAAEGSGTSDAASARCALTDATGASLAITVQKDKARLTSDLRRIDETILVAVLVSTGLALLLAALLARSLGRPIEQLAKEASKVASGEARPLRVQGSGEMAELALAFNRMLDDLEGTRRRLAAASRVAAWREAARRVAHEIKNPLAPIRAAVETLRRLRAREDPAFDEYFDEATRTVLDEVHRIAGIVTDFTRFARMPSPRPTDVDLIEVAKHVVQLEKAHADGVRLDLVIRRTPPIVRADRDQIIQVLTNLVQNALDAVRGRDGAEVVVTVDGADARNGAVVVSDNGPGLSEEIAPRLFEPYATSKPHGTGLGLAIAQRIAVEHDGELAYTGPREGGGAVFKLVLPVSGPKNVHEATPPPSA